MQRKFNNIQLQRAILLCFVSFIFISTSAQDLKEKNHKYIEIESGLIANKMIPKIIFYLPQSYDTTTLDWIYFFEVDTVTFNCLQKLIANKLSKQVAQKDKYFLFSIKSQDLDEDFFSTDKKTTIEIFDKILRLLHGYRNLQLVKKVFEDTKMRFYK